MRNSTWVLQAEQQAKDAQANRVLNPSAVRAVQPAPETESPTYVGPKEPVLMRAYWWVFGMLFGKLRIVRSAQWWWRVPLRISLFVRAITSKRVSDAVYGERMAACATCKHHTIRVHQTKRQKSYCGLCGCPEWRVSELKFKNRLSRWYCPRRRHEGPYPEDAWIAKLPVLVREKTRAAYRDTGAEGGCKGCGKGGA